MKLYYFITISSSLLPLTSYGHDLNFTKCQVVPSSQGNEYIVSSDWLHADDVTGFSFLHGSTHVIATKMRLHFKRWEGNFTKLEAIVFKVKILIYQSKKVEVI